MGTGTSLRVLSSHQTNKLSPVDEEKVSNIVEICNVSRDEAVRVLDACHMDETVAIERFLSGAEVSTWSHVSKKKRQTTQSRVSSGPRTTYGSGRAKDRENERDHDVDHRDRERSSSFHLDSGTHQNGYRRGSRHHGYSQRSRDHPSGSNRKRNSQSQNMLSSNESSIPLREQTETWGAPSQEEDSWVNHGTVNSSPGEVWPDCRAPSTESWTDNSSTVVHAEPTTSAWSAPSQSTVATSSSAWPVQSITDGGDKSPDPAGDHECASSRAPLTVESPPTQPVNPLSAVKRTFNYAAAAAAGTTHEKPASLPPEIPGKVSLNASGPSKASEPDVSLSESLHEPVSGEAVDGNNRRNREGRNQRPRVQGEIQALEGIETRQTVEHHTEPYESHRNGAVQEPESMQLKGASRSGSWRTSPRPSTETQDGSRKRLSNKAASVTVASAAAVASDQSAGDSLSLQFGSFGLSGLDGVNWSASEQKPSEAVANATVASEATAVPSVSSITMQSKDPSPVGNPAIAEATAVDISSVPLPTSTTIEVPQDASNAEQVRTHAATSSSGPLPLSSSSGGTGIVPVLPVGPGGNFAPTNYGTPYLMPPLHGYSPAMTSYENTGDLGSSRAPNLVPPGSLPMYDPTTVPGMTSANGKYGGIPGLGDMGGLQGVQTCTSKEGQAGSSGEIEKPASVATSALPAGMDPLAPPYMMPSYPSMQYPMYTFPTGPYGPPGMAPPGPSPFPYPPPGQVSSQGGRGGFGFEDGSAGLTGSSRAGSALSESMYTPGYLNTSVNQVSSQKASNDGSFKPMRGNPGTALGGVGMGGGIVPGMTYGDYAGNGMPGASNGVGTTGSSAGGWNNSRQQHSGSHVDSANAAGIGSNQAMTAASPSSSVYAAGPTGHGGYWGPQQGGYYP